ncbi:MAG: M48 family metallopeptidase [Synergistaceae bacterium]|nr:M48 family metallopeptidase [Synergistaceae bacterium]MBQ6001310.1 M48 family metallopeptidase [Synergistaceae bacterium]MBR0167659.1 M48 family metallopeptidase [Synergistaceae bacterium]
MKLKTLALILLLTLCGTSYAEISKITVNKAWKRITKADNFSRIPINFENDKTPNAWVKFDEAGNYTVHVTKGLMRILDNEDEIAGILGHELGHIRLGHYESNSSAGAVRTVIGINSEIYPMNNPAGENSFGQKQETQADSYSTALLRKARYSPRGLYDALTKIHDKGYGNERSGFNSHPASRERLAHIAEEARITSHIKANSLIGMDDIAEIMLGR